jgi:transposase InsO family protein
MKDSLTKWVEIFPIPDKTSGAVATCFQNELVCRHGCPKVVITDRGAEFSSQLWKDTMEVLGIQHIRTTPAYPRSDGQAENHMRTMKDMLSSYVNKFHDDWDVHLPLIGQQYRSTVNDATGYTPFYLLHGREMRQAGSPDILSPIAPNLHEYADSLAKVLKHTWDYVSEKVVKNVEVMNQVPRKKLPFVPYQVGDYFYLKQVPRRF